MQDDGGGGAERGGVGGGGGGGGGGGLEALLRCHGQSKNEKVAAADTKLGVAPTAVDGSTESYRKWATLIDSAKTWSTVEAL